MKHLKTFNEASKLLKYNPELTPDDTDIASMSVWRKILQVVAQIPVEGNLEDYTNKVVVEVLSQFHTPSEQMEQKAEKIKERFGQAIEDYYNKHKK